MTTSKKAPLATMVTVTVAIVTALVGVGVGTARAATNPASSVTIRLSNDIDSLDPIRAAVGDAIAASMYSYDTLLADVNGKPAPQLARRWHVTDDSITLDLRNDVTCADGTKLTPADYVANVKRFVDPKNPSKNVGAVFGTGKVRASVVKGQNAIKISVSKPFGGLATGMARVPVVCPAGLKNPNALKTRTFGTGPYVLTKAVVGDQYTYVKRAGYRWGPNGATNNRSPQRVVMRVVTSDTTAANLLLSGDLDIAAITGSDRSRVEHAAGMQRKLVTPSEWHLMFNEGRTHPGYDENVRKALALAVNRQQLASAAGGQFARVANSFLAPGATCYSASDRTAIPSMSLTGARKALAAAGYSASKPLKINLVIFNAMPSAADYLIDAFKKIGVQVKSRVVDGNELGRVLLQTFDWDVTIANTFPTDPILASGYVSGEFPPKGANHTFIVNPTYDKYSQLARQHVTSTQCARWIKADRALFSRYDLLPLYWEDVASYSKGFNFTPVKYLTAGIYPTSIRKR